MPTSSRTLKLGRHLTRRSRTQPTRGGAGGPGAFLLQNASWYVDARAYSGTGALLDQSPNRLHAKQGSTGVAQIVPAAGGGNCLSLPGANGNLASLPSGTVDVTGDIEIVARVNVAAYSSPSFYMMIVHRRNPNNRWYLRYNVNGTEGRLSIGGWVGTVITTERQSTAADPYAIGVPHWIKATRNATTGEIVYYTAPDSDAEPTAWTQLGTTQTSATGVYDSGASNVEIGSYQGSTHPFNGDIYQVIVRDGIDGTDLVDIDFTTAPLHASSFTADTGQTVTVTSSGADTNDPLFLAHTGEDYVYLPGSSGNAPSTPDSAALDLASDMTITMRVDPTDWTPSALSTFISKWTAGADASWALQLTTGGLLSFVRYDGTANRTYNSSVAAPGVEGTPLWIKAEFDQTDGSVSSVVFSTSTDQVATPDAVTWTQLGSRVTNASVAANQLGSAPVQIGAYGTGGATSPLAGKVYYAELRNNLGAVVAQFAASDIVSPYATVVGGAGETWTINRATSGRKTAVVDRPLFLFGTDDYMEVADNDLLDFGAGQAFTVVAAYRNQANLASTNIIAKRTGDTAAGWNIRHGGTATTHVGLWGDGAANSTTTLASAATAGPLTVAVLRRDAAGLGAVGNAAGFGSGVTGNSNTSNAEAMRIGRLSGAGTSYDDMEFLGAAVFRRALSDAEIAQVVQEFQ